MDAGFSAEPMVWESDLEAWIEEWKQERTLKSLRWDRDNSCLLWPTAIIWFENERE
jgi:hypothetical protein